MLGTRRRAKRSILTNEKFSCAPLSRGETFVEMNAVHQRQLNPQSLLHGDRKASSRTDNLRSLQAVSKRAFKAPSERLDASIPALRMTRRPTNLRRSCSLVVVSDDIGRAASSIAASPLWWHKWMSFRIRT